MEILMVVTDMVNPGDAEKSERMYKRGDVITVQEDDWQWSPAELINPDWRIYRITGLTQLDADSLVSRGFTADPTYKPKRKRAMFFDVDDPSLPQAAKDHAEDASRINRFHQMARAQFIPFAKGKPPETP